MTGKRFGAGGLLVVQASRQAEQAKLPQHAMLAAASLQTLTFK